MERVIRIIFIAVIIFIVFSSGRLLSLELCPHSLHPNIVTYQYLTTCPNCGSELMEGYYSFVDGYNQEECKECGYYTVTESQE